MIHPLKIWPQFFEAIIEPNPIRRKTCEIRTNDRNFQCGDVLELREYNPNTEEFSSRKALRLVTHIVEGPPFLPEGVVVMSLADPQDIESEGAKHE